MSESTSHIPIGQSSPKSFGVVFSIVFLMVGLYPLINSEGIRAWALFVSAVFLLLAYVRPNILSLPNKLWFKFGILWLYYCADCNSACLFSDGATYWNCYASFR